MLQLTWLFLGTIALLTTVGAMRAGYDAPTRLIAAGMALILWAVWAFGAYSVDVVSHGSKLSYSYPQLAYVGGLAAIIMFLFVVRLAFALLRDDGQTANPEELNPMEGP